MEVMVDSNVILDIATEDSVWFRWSSDTLSFYAQSHTLVINPVIYSEVSVGYETMEELENILPRDYFRRVQIPWEAAGGE